MKAFYARHKKKLLVIILLAVFIYGGLVLYSYTGPTLFTFLSNTIYKPKLQATLNTEANMLKENLPFRPLANATIASQTQFPVTCDYLDLTFDEGRVNCGGMEYIYSNDLQTDEASTKDNSEKAKKLDKYLQQAGWKRSNEPSSEPTITKSLPDAIATRSNGDIIFAKKIGATDCSLTLHRYYGPAGTIIDNTYIGPADTLPGQITSNMHITIGCSRTIEYLYPY